MRYYDLKETPLTGKTFLDGGTGRVKQDDDSVSCWFNPLPNGYKRSYTIEGLPFNEVVQVNAPAELTAAQQIEDLEAQVTPRHLRGAALGDQYAIDHIQAIEDKIEAMRG